MPENLTKDFSAASQDERDVQSLINLKRRNRIVDSTIITLQGNEKRKPGRNKSPLWLFKTIFLVSVIICATACYTILKVIQGLNASVNGPSLASQTNYIAETKGISYGTPRVFPVDRPVVEKLEYLHRASGDLDELDILSWNGHWPPLVTHLPEPKSFGKKVASYADIVDFCGLQSMSQNSCRFLLPYRIAEQESKARLHFLQLISLAQVLNRTLVLPNVGKSRMGACFGWDFEMYYDLSSLEDYGIQFARLDILKGWIDLRASRRLSTFGQFFLFTEKYFQLDLRPSLDFELQAINVDAIDTGCFISRFQNLNMTKHNAVSLNIIYPRKTPTIGMEQKLTEKVQDAIKELRPDTNGTEPAQEGPHILVLNWDLRHSIFPLLGFDLRYSPQLTDLARDLSPSGPYVAIHWRMETIAPDNLPQCAYALVDALTNLLNEPSLAGDIKFVWLASDMPFSSLPDAVSKSGTLKELTSFHEEATKIVRSAFQADGELANWSLHTLEQSMNLHYSREGYHAEWLSDSGVQGILDKIIAARATLFIGGTRRCSRVSSYTRQIIEMRKVSRKTHGAPQRNLVDLFG